MLPISNVNAAQARLVRFMVLRNYQGWLYPSYPVIVPCNYLDYNWRYTIDICVYALAEEHCMTFFSVLITQSPRCARISFYCFSLGISHFLVYIDKLENSRLRFSLDHFNQIAIRVKIKGIEWVRTQRGSVRGVVAV